MNDIQPAATPSVQLTSRDYLSWLFAAAFLFMVLKLHLLPALLASLLVFEVVRALVPWLKLRGLGVSGPQLIAVTLIALIVIATMAAGIGSAAGLLRNSGESLPALFERMAQIIENSREQLPDWILIYLPDTAVELRTAVVGWLRSNTGLLQIAGTEFGRGLAHVLIGMIAGALVSLHLAAPVTAQPPLAAAITEQAARLSSAFRNVVFAQFWISGINTLFTWIYLGWVLPAFGVELPFRGLLVIITFVCGLIPILGNLMSNTVIFVVSLSNSLLIALVSLGYLIVIHKLEYFLNARIIGSHIRAHAWELLIAMLIMEAAFGIAGLISAPIFYAFFKDSLREKKLL
ncbi:MAG: AI-2E family transporter [Pseudomonadota bacterium]